MYLQEQLFFVFTGFVFLSWTLHTVPFDSHLVLLFSLDTFKLLPSLFISVSPFPFPLSVTPFLLYLFLTLPYSPQVNVPVDKGTRSVLQRTLVATAFSMAPRSQVSHGDRHYIAEYSCCPPPLLVPLLCTAEVRTVVVTCTLL